MKLQALPALAALFLLACQTQEIINLEKEERFVLGIGALEDELDLFQRNGLAPAQDTHLYLQEGMFYILNGPRAKVLEFTSFGDLLRMIFNPDLNPPPITLKDNQTTGMVSTKVAVPFPFHSTGRFVVTPTRDLYIQDRQIRPQSRLVGNNLDESVILRFDRRGEYQDYIGREGVAGSPFNLIHGLYTDDRSGLHVVTRSLTTVSVYSYLRSGDLIYQRDFPIDSMPLPQEYAGLSVQVIFEKAVVDWSSPWVYLYLTYVSSVLDAGSRAQTGIQVLSSWVHTIDLETAQVLDSFQVPRVISQERDGEITRVYERPLELLGLTRGRDFCFLGLERPGLFRVLFTDTRGEVTEQRGLSIDLEEMKFYRFSLASNGTLAALLGDGQRVRAVWWRTDRLLGLFNATPGF